MALLGLGVLSGIAWRLYRTFQREHVSAAWLAEDDRRQGTSGIEGVNWKWPYRGYKEDPKWNTIRERRRA